MKLDFTAKKIAVIIPAYNAADTIIRVISNIPEWISYIIVVNDCSTDTTSDLVKNLNKPRVILMDHRTNQGVGGAMKTGYQRAHELEADIIIKMDSDDQMDPQYLGLLLSPILKGKADYTKGNRFIDANELVHMPFIRRFGNISLSFFTKLASGYWNIFDPTNGYTAITKNALRVIDLSNLDDRYFFESSLLMELYLHRIVVRDVFIPARYRGEKSSLSEFKAFIEFPPKLLKGLIHRFYIMYVLKDFNAITLLSFLGIFSVLFGIIWGVVFWEKSAVTNVPASTGTIMIAVLPIILGIQFILQALMLDIHNVPDEILDGDQ